MSVVTLVGEKELERLCETARTTPRLRKNLNLHTSETSACQRLFNAVEPDSYIQPHRHLEPEKDETLVLVRGRLGLVTFDDTGAVTGSALLDRETVAVDIPHGLYHTALALESGTVFFEAKAGPYRPLTENEKAGFAPGEGEPGAPLYLERLRGLFK